MDINALYLIIVGQFLVILVLIAVLATQGRFLSGSYPTDVKQVIGALAGLLVVFATKTPTTADDQVVNQAILPILKLFGIEPPKPDIKQ